MIKDPVVEEVRKVRRKIESELGDNPRDIYQHYVKLQNKYSSRLVRGGHSRTLKLKKAV